MREYIGMIEVLGETGELQPLYWNPSHLVDGRSILIVDEPGARIWVWLGRGTTLIQRTTAIRQARFIKRNGFHVGDINVGTKATEFIEIPGELKDTKADLLRALFDEHPKKSEYLVVVETKEEISTFDDEFQTRVDAIEQTIIPEPIRQPAPVRRRMLSYEEQLASKVLFAVADCYGHATMKPLGPNAFEVNVIRLQLRFQSAGDAILFSYIRAASQDDIDAFSRCYGQQPELMADGQQFIDTSIAGVAVPPEAEVVTVEKAGEGVSVFDTMKKQLSQLRGVNGKPEEGEEEITEIAEEEKSEDIKKEEKKNKAKKSGGSTLELFP